jgi:hypothetical protein
VTGDAIDPIQEQVCALIRRELRALDTAEHLDRGRAFELAPVLRAGGVLVFPHIDPRDCGHHVAACVHACLDAEPAAIIALSVHHEATPAMVAARARVNAGQDSAYEPLRGIHGPGCGRSETWRNDHALIAWRHFLAAECARRGIAAPPVFERYPFLAAGEPGSLPGIEDLQELARDAVIVATLDPLHHGAVYGTPHDRLMEPDARGLAVATEAIQEGIALLGLGEYAAFERHCGAVISDGADVGEVLHHVRGPLVGHVLEVVASDSSEIGDAPHPTWVAGALMAWTPPGAAADGNEILDLARVRAGH